MALIAVIMVVAVSCSTMQRTTDDYYATDEPARRYMYNSYGNQVIVLERDPYTGRYYQVSPYGYYSGSPYSNDYRYYNRNYNNRYYQAPVRETSEEKPRESEKINKVREIIRGKN